VSVEDVLVPVTRSYGLETVLGSLVMIADAVPWRFKNWMEVEPSDRNALILDGQKYLRWLITQYNPPHVIAMGNGAREAFKLLCGIDVRGGALNGPANAAVGSVRFELVGTYHPSPENPKWGEAIDPLRRHFREWLRRTQPPLPGGVLRRRPK
jgi:uracil-DNA glycosylase